MTRPLSADERARRDAGQQRLAGGVIAAAMVIWIAAQVFGPRLGLDGRYALLIDLAAMAAFIFALAVTLRLWRRRS